MIKLPSDVFDVFISYSHKADRDIAPRLQSGLEKLAKPWYRRRAIRVFRDETDLGANPDMWSEIEERLTNSRNLILLCSPEAAKSRWVKKEIEHWLGLGRYDRLFFALTEGVIVWAPRKKDFNWSKTTALPPTLKGQLKQEPGWVDLRGESEFNKTPDAFRHAVARLSAPIRGLDLEQLVSADHREHRRTLRHAWSAAICLFMLFLAVGAFAAISEIRRQEAFRQNMISQAQRLAALAREQHTVFRQDERAVLLALKAYQLNEEHQGGLRSVVDDTLRQILEAPHFSRILDGGGKSIFEVAISPDSRWLVAGGDNEHLLVWDLRTPTSPPRTFKDATDSVSSMVLEKKGRILVTGHLDGRIRFWDLNNLELRRETKFFDEPVLSLAINKENGLLAAGHTDGSIALFSLIDPEAGTKFLDKHTRHVNSVTFSKNGRYMLSASSDNDVLIWDLHNIDDSPRVFRGHGGQLETVAISPDGKWLVTAGEDAYETSRLRLWRWPSLQPTPYGFVGQVSAIAFSPDGSELAAVFDSEWDRTVRLWDLSSPAKPPRKLPGHEARVWGVAYSADGDFLVTAGEQGLVRVWDRRAVGPIKLDHPDAVWSVDVSSDGRYIAAGGRDGAVRVWKQADISASPIGATISINAQAVRFHPRDSMKFAVATMGGMTLASIDGNRLQLRSLVQPREHWFRSADFDSAGDLLAGGGKGGVYLWRLSKLDAPPTRFNAPDGIYFSVALSSDGRLLAAGDISGRLYLWEVHDPNAEPLIVGDHNGRVRGLDFDKSGRQLVSAGEDGNVHLWDLKNTSEPPQLITKFDTFAHVARFLANDKIILSSGNDGTVRLSRLDKGQYKTQVLRTLDDNALMSAASNDVARTVVAGSFGSRKIYVWDASTELLAKKVCQTVWRNLTADEWSRFMGPDLPYEILCKNLGSRRASIKSKQEGHLTHAYAELF